MKKRLNILVTGGVGFIGSHLVEELIARDFTIVVPYLTIDRKSYFALRGLRKHVKLVKLDLVDRKKTASLIKRERIDYIFHLAAQTIVTDAYIDPYYTLYNNIVSTINLLEIVRNTKKIKGIIVASSDKAYGKTTAAYTEESPLKGDHPYDVSKSATDLIAQTYFKTYGTPVVVTRFANVYGEGDLHESRIVPGVCKAFALHEKLLIRSNGKFIRDYIYVKDVVSGYLFLFDNFSNVVGKTFNVSSKDSLSVIELINNAEKSIGKKLQFSITNTAVNEIPYQHLNDKKIRAMGWKSSYKFESIFPQILAWYQMNVYRKESR